MLLSRLVNWLDRYRISQRAPTCSFVVFASYGFPRAASLTIYICAPSSAVLQVLRARSVKLQTYNWESVESETGYARGGPQVMTGLRWHLLKCSSGLPGLDGVIPSFHFFHWFSTNCSRQAKGHQEPPHSCCGMPLIACQSLHCASLVGKGALLAGIPLCPPIGARWKKSGYLP